MAGDTEFFEAVKQNDVSTVENLVRRDATLVRATTEHDKTGLHWAAEKDAVDVARVLIDSGADVEAKSDWGASPLDWAATLGGHRVGNLLLSHGASGLTLIVAAALGRLGDVESIVESGQDLSAHRRRDAPIQPDDDHWFADSAHSQGDVISDALYAAARNGHTAVVAYLLDHGANVDARGVFGGTAIHWAAMNGHRETVNLLRSRGANLTITDHKFDSTPAGWAKEGGHKDLEALLSSPSA